MSEFEGKERIIQEFVPGKQVTLAHVIASPDKDLYGKLGLIDAEGAIGIMTITPSEGAMIAADIASKSADIKVGFVDRFNGSLVITGDVAAVEVAIRDVMAVLCDRMGFAKAPVTKHEQCDIKGREEKAHHSDRPVDRREDDSVPADQQRGASLLQNADGAGDQQKYDRYTGRVSGAERIPWCTDCDFRRCGYYPDGTGCDRGRDDVSSAVLQYVCR